MLVTNLKTYENIDDISDDDLSNILTLKFIYDQYKLAEVKTMKSNGKFNSLLNSVIPVVGASEFSAIPAGGAAQDEIDGGKTGENSVKFETGNPDKFPAKRKVP